MIPSNRWFPTTLAARAAWFANFAVQFAIYAAGLGLTAYATQVDHDNEDFQSIAATRLTAKNFESAIVDFLKELTEFAVGTPQPVFPSENFAAPPRGVAAGLFQRLDELRTLIMAQPTYTVAIGTALGIEPVGPGANLSPDLVKPDITVDAATTGYLFSIVVKHRELGDQWIVQTRTKGGEWQSAGTFTGKSTDITVTPTIPGDPVLVEVRVQLRKNNANYGQVSDIATVTVNP